jgi:integrase
LTQSLRYDLYPRQKTKHGRKIWYYRTYNEYGKRTSGKSTGQTSKTAAKEYVINLIKKDVLTTKGNPTFAEYAQDWWIWGECEYIERRLARGRSISRSYADTMRNYLENHILPYFAEIKLQKITPKMIEDWLFSLLEKEGKNPKPLSAITANNCLTTLRIMLNEAVRLEYIGNNPALKVEPLQEKPQKRDILTLEEVKALLNVEMIDQVWDGDRRHYTINLLAASTGIRMGECQALKICKVHEDYIAVHHSWERRYGLKPPKRNSYREVPIPRKTAQYLHDLISLFPYQEPDDLVFWGKDRSTPIRNEDVRRAFYAALAQIGISEEERTKRNITFHSWRYFYNSLLRGRIHDSKLQRLTGHKTDEMTEHYTRFNIDDFRDVKDIQERYFR